MYRTYSDGNVLGGREEPVDEDTHKRRVQAKLDGQKRQLSVGHTLRHDNSANCDT